MVCPMYTDYKKHSNLLMLFFLHFITVAISEQHKHFIYHGFAETDLHIDGLASIHRNGLLQLTNTTELQKGHAFSKSLVRIDNNVSFSTSFVFAIVKESGGIPHTGQGFAFVISPSMDFSHAVPAEYLGLFNASANGSPANHVFAVELDTVQNALFGDINANHVGIDVNSLKSVTSASAAYFSEKDSKNKSLQLTSGKPIQVWIDYNAVKMLVDVKLAPIEEPKPKHSLLTTHINLSSIISNLVYIGFSSSTGLSTNDHYILGWSWNQSGQAQSLDPSKLPSLPKLTHPRKKISIAFVVLLVILVLFLISICLCAYAKIMRKKYAELHDVWEEEYTAHRYLYKDLYIATKGFKESEILGFGGFGKVYKGTIPHTNTVVAVKKISHDSKQGLQEFVAEIVSMRRLSHRNLVQLLGYCRRKGGELLLVYEFMPNGSLDKYLFQANVYWHQRVKIIKGVASALLYLHEEWEQVVLHRDIKASNVLLDANMNARLSDFGLSRLYDHDTGPRTTRIVGTMGYIAPELIITGKPTKSTDVFAFGMFMLEVVCGRRPICLNSVEEENLVDWVFQCWEDGEIRKTIDPKLEDNYNAEESDLILRLGLMCCHNNPRERPSMRQVMQVLDDSNSRTSDQKIPILQSSDIASDVCPVSSTHSVAVHDR